MLRKMFGIEAPIFAFSHCRDVVVEATLSGGFGVLGASTFSPEQLKIELDWIDSRVGGRPYGIDVLMPREEDNEKAAAIDLSILDALPPEHVSFVDRILSEHGIPDLSPEEKETSLKEYIQSLAITRAQAQQRIDIVFEHPLVRLIVSALGPTPADIVERAHASGIRIGGLVGSARHARKQVAAGADLVIAAGYEAGGHTGEIASMVLVPEVVDAVAPVPVLAAGGIGRGRQVAAALALGAEGVWCGTVWLGTVESETSSAVKEKLFAATSSDTKRTRCNSGKPARRLNTEWVKAWDAPDAPPPLPMPLQGVLTHLALKRVERAGTSPLLTYPAGQIVGHLKAETSVRQVYQEMREELAESVSRMTELLEV